jgi:hypothetical protein
MDVDYTEPTGPVDMFLRLTVVIALFGWNVVEGLSLRTPYPATMVALWDSPVWRMALLLAIWLGAEWCPRVGMMTALAVVSYIVDMVQII